MNRSLGALAFGLLALAGTAWGADDKIVLGITQTDGKKYDVEFQKYDKSAAFYQDNGIRAALMEYGGFCEGDVSPDNLLGELRKYNVVLLGTREEGAYRLTAEHVDRAEKVSRALAKYVEEGGGLLLQPRAVRYANDEDEKYWNLVFKKFGLQILHEGIFDGGDQAENEIKPNLKAKFFHTANIKDHPATAGVKELWLPKNSYHPNAGTPAMSYGPEWEVVVKGGKTAKSYASDPQLNIFDASKDGTYKTEPPIVAVRAFGKGRVACVPVDPIHTGMNYGNPFWSHVVERGGSDGMRLMASTVKWLAEPSRGDPAFGTLEAKPPEPVSFAASRSWDGVRPDEPVRGVLGAHSSYSDGQGSVEDYVNAAKAAGLSFIVFADPLEALSPEKLKQLKKDCARLSNGEFYACPGVEFTDGSGVRWAFWGQKVDWPVASFVCNNRSYKLWDGKVVKHYGKYIEQCNYCPSAVVSYKNLRDVGAAPENLWWFYNVFPYAYEGTKLIADNFPEWFFALRDLRAVSPVSFTRMKAPAEVKSAAEAAFTGMKSLPDAVKALNTRCSPYWAAKDAGQFVSYGGEVEVLRWDAVNYQMEENWQHTRGAQRVKLKFTVKSPAGINDVTVYDADNGPLRHFISEKGENLFSADFELAHDKQRYLTLVATDKRGNKAISSFILLYCYKQGLFRCGDNLNILGPLGLCWHPDRNQSFQLFKDFRNAEQLSVQGWDRSGPDCPVPSGQLCDWVNLKGVGEYPWPGEPDRMLRKKMAVKLASSNLQLAEMAMTDLAEKFDNEARPGPSFASVARKVSDNEFFERVDRLVAPMDRVDHYVVWNHRRLREGTKDYQGSYLWHEGEIRFKKDVTLQGDVPIPLAWTDAPLDMDKGWGKYLVVKDAAKGDLKMELQDSKRTLRVSGRVAAGGFAARLNCPVGYIGTLVPKGMDFAYSASLPGRLYVGIGKDGERVKAGAVMRYAFLTGVFTDQGDGPGRMEYVAKAFNLAGGADGYPVDMRVGKLLDATFFCAVQAEDNAAAFTLGSKKDLGIDLPIRVEGIADNGCAAVYTSQRRWFRFVAVADGAAYFQEPIDERNEIWAGNVFVSDNPAVKLALVVDGQDVGKPPFLEIHNPTAKAVRTVIASPKSAPVFGGTTFEVDVPAGSSVKKTLQ